VIRLFDSHSAFRLALFSINTFLHNTFHLFVYFIGLYTVPCKLADSVGADGAAAPALLVS